MTTDFELQLKACLEDLHGTNLAGAAPTTTATAASKTIYPTCFSGRPPHRFDMGCEYHFVVVCTSRLSVSFQRQHGWRTAKRPGVDYFLAYLSQFYEVVIFTTQYHYVREWNGVIA